MSSFLVFAGPGAAVPDERSKLVADRFAPLALAFPVIWLLFNRLWFEAAIAFVLYIASMMMIADAAWVWPGLALGFAISLVTALEGRNWRGAALARRGWRLVDLVEADDADTAFEIHVRRAGASDPPASAPAQAVRQAPVRPGRIGNDTDAIGLVPVERS
ncbi:DUF2628 domain-containing protein [Hoeflea sp.]|uniref:DUF2628 domain-containing protein n=1 Tax=Hoeflea sp. TaxID=1940281 RepID=UPI003B51BA32